MKKNTVILFLVVAVSLSACAILGINGQSDSGSVSPIFERTSGMGPGSGMMDRHHAQIPDKFAGLANPIPADDESLARGEEIYTTHCATCHGDYGNGDGPGSANLDPAPAAIAHTSRMMSDAYLFWRITEGGTSFKTGMLPFRDILDEQSRWDVINYMRALGRGQVQPGEFIGGQPFDPSAEITQRTEMLALAVEQGIITQGQADLFFDIHAVMDEYLWMEADSGLGTGSQANALPQILDTLVDNGEITQDQASGFLDIHDRLVEAGLMQ